MCASISVCAGFSKAQQSSLQFAGGGQPHLFDASLDGERVSEAVDVFRGAENVDNLAEVRQTGVFTEHAGCGFKVFADEVFDSFHVVARDSFEFAEAFDVFGGKIAGQCAQVVALSVGQGRRARKDGVVEQVDQPLNLDVYARTIQAGFGQVIRKRCNGCAVATVKRRQRFARCCQIGVTMIGREKGNPVCAHSVIFSCWRAVKKQCCATKVMMPDIFGCA